MINQRPAELAHIIAWTIRQNKIPVEPHATFVEACLLRPWPGNDRELIERVTHHAATAIARGKPQLRSDDLDHDTGRAQEGMQTVNNAQRDTMPGPGQRSR